MPSRSSPRTERSSKLSRTDSPDIARAPMDFSWSPLSLPNSRTTPSLLSNGKVSTLPLLRFMKTNSRLCRIDLLSHARYRILHAHSTLG